MSSFPRQHAGVLVHVQFGCSNAFELLVFLKFKLSRTLIELAERPIVSLKGLAFAASQMPKSRVSYSRCLLDYSACWSRWL